MKMTSSKMVNIALAVALLASLVLLNVKLSTSTGVYDPWADYNGDGKINIQDVSPLGVGWQATGDPTRYITIGGHATKLAYNVSQYLIPAYGTYISPPINVDGYSKVTICIWLSTYYSNTYLLYAQHVATVVTSYCVDTVITTTGFGYGLVKTYDVPNQVVFVEILSDGAGPEYLCLDAYVVA